MFLKHGYGCIQKLEPKVNGGPLSCGAQKTFPDNVGIYYSVAILCRSINTQ